jgi:Ni/Fe-hydrogenase 1 B-type cytochrome subunit
MARTKEANHSPQAVAMHWAHLAAMAVLLISGWYINSPFFKGGMGLMRYSHFIAMYIVILVLVVRVYWAFLGSSGDFHNFAPHQTENRGKLIPTISYYLFIRKNHPETGKYNPLQKTTYMFWPVLIILQALTGFALYTGNIFGLPFLHAPDAMGWLVDLCGGLANVRIIHYLIMWVFILTVGVHIYLTLAEDIREFGPMFLGSEAKEKRG